MQVACTGSDYPLSRCKFAALEDGLQIFPWWIWAPCVTQVLDSLLASLTKYTALLNPLSPKASVLFGLNDKARMATETIFELANRWVLPVLTVPI